jgi:hypothetical protein
MIPISQTSKEKFRKLPQAEPGKRWDQDVNAGCLALCWPSYNSAKCLQDGLFLLLCLPTMQRAGKVVLWYI